MHNFFLLYDLNVYLYTINQNFMKLEMCQDDTDAHIQGHPHPHAGILQKIAIRRDGNSPDRTANGRLFSI